MSFQDQFDSHPHWMTDFSSLNHDIHSLPLRNKTTLTQDNQLLREATQTLNNYYRYDLVSNITQTNKTQSFMQDATSFSQISVIKILLISIILWDSPNPSTILHTTSATAYQNKNPTHDNLFSFYKNIIN